jgi:hypothetical protein
MAEFTLRIDNMHCGSCIRRVSQALSSADGVRHVLTHRGSQRQWMWPLRCLPRRAIPRGWKNRQPCPRPSPFRCWA